MLMRSGRHTTLKQASLLFLDTYKISLHYSTECASQFDRNSIKLFGSEIHQHFRGKKSSRYSHVSRSKEGLQYSDFQKAWSKSLKTNLWHIWKRPNLNSNVLETSKLSKMLYSSWNAEYNILHWSACQNAFKKQKIWECSISKKVNILASHAQILSFLVTITVLTQFFLSKMLNAQNLKVVCSV